MSESMTVVTQIGRSCANDASHTECPNEYLAWHDWAEKKMKTHKQVKCPKCGLYAIWVPKNTEEDQ